MLPVQIMRSSSVTWKLLFLYLGVRTPVLPGVFSLFRTFQTLPVSSSSVLLAPTGSYIHNLLSLYPALTADLQGTSEGGGLRGGQRKNWLTNIKGWSSCPGPADYCPSSWLCPLPLSMWSFQWQVPVKGQLTDYSPLLSNKKKSVLRWGVSMPSVHRADNFAYQYLCHKNVTNNLILSFLKLLEIIANQTLFFQKFMMQAFPTFPAMWTFCNCQQRPRATISFLYATKPVFPFLA